MRAPRPLLLWRPRPKWHGNAQKRPFHRATAQFITIDSDGHPVSGKTEIRVGQPNESYVYLEPNIGNAIKSSVLRQISIGLTHNKKLPLKFNHKSRHLSHGDLPVPQVHITQDLPRPTTADISPATLWLSGNWHAITLDGTPDADFERASRDSADELKGTLEKLKKE
ncbi:hypothetical protein LX36DRAFT_660654 [Colletotrichum falcatum]|nr:hypothetical protein LX36DRAFT_660654 [Colletotrichum falcatum]